MRKSQRHALEAHGWRVGSVADFLELTPEEVGVVQLALRRIDAPRAPRETPGMPPAMAGRTSASERRGGSARSCKPDGCCRARS
jgi:hypothetical protein